MRTWMGLVGLFALGCSAKHQDDCQRFVDRSRPVLEKMGQSTGKELSSAQLDELVDKCRKAKPGNADEVLQKCVLAASDDAAVTTCWQTALGGYLSKSKQIEAKLQLNRLGKRIKVAYDIDEKFPAGKAGPTPADACCNGPDHKCAVTDAWAKDPIWSKLEFQVDEPHLFRYSYESDGKTATAKAIGDLDCDGIAITYTLSATVGADGLPSVMITEPPPNTD